MLKKLALAAVAATALASAAHAATEVGTFVVSATVASTCTITNLVNFNFGNIGGTASTINGPSPTTVGINCSAGLPYTVTLASANPGGTTGFRMTDGTNPMEYQLFANSYANVWDGTATAATSFTGTGSPAFVSMFGQIPVQTPPAGGWLPGNYTDTVTLTVTY